MMEHRITFTQKIWKYQGKGAWFFITLPEEEAQRIKFFSDARKSGWGSIRVRASIGRTSWETSIFPDSKLGSYLLPIKASVRAAEKISEGDEVSVFLELQL